MTLREPNGLIPVSLKLWQWAEVATSLKRFINSPEARAAIASRSDAVAALQEIDRVMRGAKEPAPLDDLI